MIRPLNEGTKYDRNAIRDLVNAGWDETIATNLINDLFKNKIHAFVHSPSWLEKYLIGIARMYREQTDGSQEQIDDFKSESSDDFDEYLMWVRANREKFGNSLDDKFNKEMSFDDVKKALEEIQEEREKENAEKMANMEFSSSNYKLVPINSYEEMHKLFGGRKTGDGSSDRYAGGGGTAWCHTNDEGTYKTWVNGGKYKFFVLMNNNYEDIPFDAKSNAKTKGKDDYGNSLMAIRTDKYGTLKNVTLRNNHVGDPSRPDNQYETYADLSEIAGFNVEQEIKKYCEERVKGFVEFEFTYNNALNGVTDESDIDNIYELKISPNMGGREIVSIAEGAFSGKLPHLKKLKVEEGIVRLGNMSFANLPELVEVTLPESLTYLGDGAFTNCKALKKINIPSQIEHIGTQLFKGCTSLESIVLPEGVQTIDLGAFVGCSSLKEINFPSSIRNIDASVFQGCSSLTKVTLPENDEYDRIPMTLFQNCTSLEEITIPLSVDTIKAGAFAGCTNLKKVNCPSVERIDFGAFRDCANLTNINWGAVTYIQESAFEGCGLENIVGLSANCDISRNAFKNCKKLKSVTLPDGMKMIDPNTFEGCTALTDVKFPSSLKRIRAQAFKDCKNLSVTLPSGVEVDKTAFEGTKMADDNNEYVVVGNKCLGFQRTKKSKQVTLVNIPDGITELGERAFASYNSIKTVIIPEGVTKIGEGAFEDCTNLETVYLPSTLVDLGISAFSGCTNLGYVKSGETLGSAVVQLPEGITKIPDGCFLGCSNLQYIGLPDSLASIGTYAFSESGLISLFIPDYVKEIETGAFSDCANLESVSIPSTLRFNKQDVFDGTNANITKRQVEANESYSKYKLSLTENDLPELYKLDIQLHYDIIDGEAEYEVDEGSILDALGELVEEKIKANKEYICRGNQFNDFEIEYTNCDDEYGVVSFEVEVDFKITGKYFVDKVKYLLRNYLTKIQYKGQTVEVEVEQVFPVLRYISE